MARRSQVADNQVLDRRGRVLVERRGLPPRKWGADAYHVLRSASWPAVIALFFLCFVLVNAGFAMLLWLGDASIPTANATLASYFWFSVQTLATIGYGVLAPADTYAHVIVTLESFVGIVLVAVTTGVFYARFATPMARVLFSRVAVFGIHDGAPTLMFRMANERRTALVEATARVYLLRDEVLADGERLRRIYDISLRRSTSPLFAISWIVYHPLDANSPLFGVDAAAARAQNLQLVVTLTGIDDRLAETVHARYVYNHEHFRFGERFVDILGTDPETGARYLDLGRFHDTVATVRG